METTTLRTICIAAVVLIPLTFTMRGASEPRQGHASGLMARITLPDGTSRTVKLEGVGCPVGMCSRVAIKGQAKGDSLVKTWLDTLAEIKDTTADDALFVGKDGTQQRLSLMHDFRVLYLANRIGGTEKLDLTKIKSLEFVAPSTSR